MEDFKDAVFFFESSSVPDELKVVTSIATAFKELPAAATTLATSSDGLDDAAAKLDDFKNKTCGSAYSLAVINLNMMNDPRELQFLLQPNVLGDPRTVFLASLRYMVGDAYSMSRNKVLRESESRERSPSCIYRYSAANKQEICKPVAELIAAYLKEAEELLRSRQSGTRMLTDTHAAKLLKNSETAFFGKRFTTTGIFNASDLRKS